VHSLVHIFEARLSRH